MLLLQARTSQLISKQGKRKAKAKKPVGPKKREPLSTNFTCLFCNHEKAVQVKLDKKNGVGELYCKICGQKFQSQINYLSAAVDVYSDWIDACESVAQEAVQEDEVATAEDKEFSSYATQVPKPAHRPALEDDDGDDVGYADEDD